MVKVTLNWGFRSLALVLLTLSQTAWSDGWPAVSPGDTVGPGQPTTGLFMVHAQANAPTSGDWISSNTGGITHYSYFIEVPLNTTNLIVEIMDPDVRQGGAGEGSASSLPHYDQQRGIETDTATNYILINPGGTAVQTINGMATSPLASHALWFGFVTVASAANGHWEVRVDSLLNAGGNVSGYGIRARATVNGVANTQLRLYADAHLGVQNYGITGVYVAHPYVSGFCQVRVRDFDVDAGVLPLGAASSITLASTTPSALSQTFNGPVLSANSNDWSANDTNVTWHTDVAVIRPGIYTTEIRPRSTAATNEFQVAFYNPNGPGDSVAPIVPALGGSWANSWRTYLPTPTNPVTVTGAPPVKPYLTQRLFHAGDGSPNPPAAGQTGNYNVTIQLLNPTAYPITFSATNLVRTFVPGATVLRANSPILVSQGSVVTQPIFPGGSGLIEWNPGTLTGGPGQSAELTYRVAVTPSAPGRIVVTGTPASNGTTAQYVDETGNTTQARATYTWGPLCELAMSTSLSVATPATLAAVSSKREGARLIVDLRTAVQVGVAYYELLELPAGGRDWVLIGGSETPAPLDHLDAKSIRLEAVTAANRFMVRTVDIDGSTMLHGPFNVAASIGGDPETHEIQWAPIQAELNAFQNLARAANADPVAFDLRVERAGVARLRFEDLPSGAWAGSSLNSIGLYDRGQPVPIKLTSADSLFGPGDAVEFIADASQSLYSKARVYQLRRNQIEPARIKQRRALNSTAGLPSMVVAREVAIDGDLVYNFSSPSPDPWHAERLLSTPSAPLTKTYTLQIDPSRVGDVYLTGSLIGGIDRPGTEPDHAVRIAVNGTEVQYLRFDALDIAAIDARVPASAVNAGANTVSLTLPATNGTDIVWLEKLGFRYQGAISAQGGAARFTPVPGDYADIPAADRLFAGDFDHDAAIDSCTGVDLQNFCQAAVVAGVDGLSARVYRRQADGSVEALLGVAATASGVAWAEPRTLGREIVVADAAGIVSVAVAAAEAPVALSGPAELLIVAHPMFVGAVEALAARRRAQGMTVQTVSVGAAYARYSGGNIDPEAIDQLIATAVAQNATRYVLIIGADTYDYQDRLGFGSISFVPSHYVHVHPVVNHAPTDGRYADVDGDQIADVAIGRLPVRTAAELGRVLEKIDAYEASGGPAVAPALFIADDLDPNGASFRERSELLRARLSGSTETAYLDDLPATQVRQRLLTAAASAADMIHYLGHSSPSTWTFPAPGLITPAELFSGILANAVRPTIVTQWGCWNSYLAAPRTDSMGHAWLLGPGAAVAVIGATSLTDVEHNVFLGYRLLDRWSAPGARIGDALMQAKRDMAVADPGAVDVLLGTTLFGDPTLRRRK